MTPPPVSFTLTTYNHESYIREAVRGALAQDYQPLEIVISDDASRDATFEIAKEEVARYRGPHRVVLNRNPLNLGLEHLPRVMGLARGRLLIRAHGDDIARPHRTRRQVEAWIGSGASLIAANARMISADGRSLGPLSQITQSGWVEIDHLIHAGNLRTTVGATFAMDRALYEDFPRVSAALYPPGMDHIIPFRAILLSGVFYVGEELLQYRQHDASMSSLMVDRTSTRTALDETAAAHNVWAQLCRLDELGYWRRRHPDQPRLSEIGQKLESRIVALTRLWVGYRDKLEEVGSRLAWLEREATKQRALNQELVLAPQTPQTPQTLETP